MRPTEWTMMMTAAVQTKFLTHAQNISMITGLDGQGRMENRVEKVRWSLFYGTERNGSVTLFPGTKPLTLARHAAIK